MEHRNKPLSSSEKKHYRMVAMNIVVNIASERTNFNMELGIAGKTADFKSSVSSQMPRKLDAA